MNSIPLTFALLAAALTPAFCDAAEPAVPYWQDKDVFLRNGRTQRTELIFHADRDAALTRPFEESEYYRSLNGTWHFRYFDSHRQLPARIEETAAPDAAAWDSIRVPGNWELQGFGTPIYVNTVYEFAPSNPEPPRLPDDVPVGVYCRSFTVPEAWAGREVYLNLCGAKSGVYVYVNGREAGYSEDSKSLVRFPIGEYLRPGENTLLLKIYRWSTGSWMECQDFWRISGIERDVYLSSEPQDKGFDFALCPTYDPATQQGRFALTLTFDPGQTADFAYELLDADGSLLLQGGDAAAADGARFEGVVPHVEAWSAEHPRLYTLLMRVDGEYTRFSVGFRSFEICDAPQCDAQGRPYRVLLVNGEPVKFKGVNIHEHNPYTGHYVTRAEMRRDLELMAANNINAIRTSHYPLPRFFYELCDSMGFYVYSEANLETHGMGYDLRRTLGNDRRWYAQHLDRILNMYCRTRNYASVTILSLGNEGGNGYNFYRAYEELERREKPAMNRPICYERAEWEWNTDMAVPQYPSAEWFRRMGEQGTDRPVCASEYAHGMGNSTGSLDLQWEAIYRYPNLQGGFIWDWVDQGFAARSADGRPYWAYGGDYGVRMPSHANFCCNGLVNPDRTPHPGLAEVKHVYQNVSITAEDAARGLFRITNRHYFTDLSGYRVCYEVLSDGRCVRRGTLTFDTAPQASETFRIALPALAADRCYTVDFRVFCGPGAAPHVAATDQVVLQQPARRAYRAPRGDFRIERQDTLIVIRAGRNEMTFDRRNGVLCSYKPSGREYFHDGFGIRPNFWRAPTDNDYGNGWPARTQQWKQTGRNFRVTTSLEQEPDRVRLSVYYDLPNGHPCRMVYTFFANGVLHVGARLQGVASEHPVELPRMGVRMRLPAGADAFRYFGRGPEENYWDRCSGSALGCYASSAEAEYYPYVRPQECGHHTACRWLAIGGVTLVADERFEFNALRNSIEDFDSEEAVAHDYQWGNFTPDEVHDPAAARNVLRRQHHIDDIVPRDFVELCIDSRQSGVGGYDSWGARAEEGRTLWSNEDHELGFTLVPGRVLPAERAAKYRYE